MHGYSSQAQISKIQSRQNGIILEDHIDFNSYNIWMPAGRQWITLSGAETFGNVGAAQVQIFPDAVTTAIHQSVRRPRSWVNGVVTVHVWYTGDIVAGTSSTIGIALNPSQQNVAIVAIAYTNNQAPSPTIANQLLVHRGFAQAVGTNSYVDVDATKDLLGVSFRRTGGGGVDSYTADFKFIGLELIYKESKHHTIGGKVEVNKRYEATAS